MSIERTREAHESLLGLATTRISSMMAEDVVFTHMATGDEHRGPEAVRRMLDYIYRQAFDARAEKRSRVIADEQAVIEGDFVGKHIGEFAGIRPPAVRSACRSAWCTISRRG